MTKTPLIRPVRLDDAKALSEIYAPYVTDTAISFEDTPPDAGEFEKRIERITKAYPYLVAEVDGRVVAYAYGGEYRARPAYRFSVEVTAYADRDVHGLGVGAALYTDLLKQLSEMNYHTAIAIVTLPNEKSAKFHERMGFEYMGKVAQAGRKFEQWHDTGIWQRHL